MKPLQEHIKQLCEVPAMNKNSVRELLAEIGVDMGVSPTANHLLSWAKLASGNNESAGKKS